MKQPCASSGRVGVGLKIYDLFRMAIDISKKEIIADDAFISPG
jgi:hypothetical protein